MKSFLSRRDFLKISGAGLCALPFAGAGPGRAGAVMPRMGLIKTAPAAHYVSLDGRSVRCGLCPKECRIGDGNRGLCRVRENRGGKLISLVYGNPCALHLDPVEKNPFFHVLPGSMSLAIATAGCNFTCKFCQTWEISQASPEDVYSFDVPPQKAVEKAVQMGARSVGYTFVEPVVFFEYMKDIGLLAREAGLLSLLHSNGFINGGPLQDLFPAIDAANIDLKSIDGEFYRSLCGGKLPPVLDTLKRLRKSGTHLEITNLVVPTRNDDAGMLKDLCAWIADELGPDTPLHFWRFYPLYKLRNIPPTPVSVLDRARETAMSAGLHYVYVGNIPGHQGENTFCPGCGNKIISRTGYMVGDIRLKGGNCVFCGNSIPGIWG